MDLKEDGPTIGYWRNISHLNYRIIGENCIVTKCHDEGKASSNMGKLLKVNKKLEN